MRGHSGGGLSMGRGFPIVSSTKQKLNTWSSMESEIVGADNFMPAIWWTRYFMEAQGYQVQDNILFQDNKSAILLEKNVNIWYSLLLIASTRVTYHWSGVQLETWSETSWPKQPLQGALFWKFRDQIMGVVPAQNPGPGKAIMKIDELNTHTVKPMKGNELKPSRGTIYNLVKPTKGNELKPSRGTIYNLVPSKEKGRHPRSVLGEVTRTKDGHSKNLTRTRNIPPKCNKQVTSIQQTRSFLTSIN
jgi:hypothetical protein